MVTLLCSALPSLRAPPLVIQRGLAEVGDGHGGGHHSPGHGQLHWTQLAHVGAGMRDI